MRRSTLFTVSMLTLGLAGGGLLQGLHKLAFAESRSPSPTETMVKSGTVTATSLVTTIFWPLWPDNTQATANECAVILSPRTVINNHSWSTDPQSGGFFLNSNIFPITFEYMIVCSRDATGTVAVQETTWGEVKAHYRE